MKETSKELGGNYARKLARNLGEGMQRTSKELGKMYVRKGSGN